MKDKKISLQFLEKKLRKHYGYDNEMALSYLRATGQVFIDGQKYVISDKDKIILNIGKENYKSMKKRK